MWISYQEHVAEWGGKKEETKGDTFVRTPFDHCSLTMAPFEDPYCAVEPDGTAYTFDLLAIVPYLKKHKKHPITGAPLA